MNSHRTLSSAVSRPKSMSSINSNKKGSLKTRSSGKSSAFPIRINKREQKIPYEKRTPIHNVAGYHLETETINEDNYKYFSRLVENTKASTPQPEQQVRNLRVASSSTAVPKPIKSVKISNKSNSTENIGILFGCKSESRLESRLMSSQATNIDMASNGSDDESEFEENTILNLIAKHKSGNDSETNSGLISNSRINMKHTATPFDDNLIELHSRAKSSFPGEAEMSQGQPRHTSAASCGMGLQFLENQKKDYLENLERFRNFKVSQYYFSNMRDFQRKLYKSNDRVQICKSVAPNNSNQLFNRIEKFDIADTYKKEYFGKTPEINEMIREQKDVWSDIRETSINRDPNNVVIFKNMKDFRFAAESSPLSRLQPPLMRNRSPKKDETYSRYKLLVQYQQLPDRAKIAI